jgi:hypothetical protein
MHSAISTRLSMVSFIAKYYTPKRPSKVGTCAGACWWRTATSIELTPVARATEGSSDAYPPTRGPLVGVDNVAAGSHVSLTAQAPY